MNIPIVKLEISGMREQIAMAFTDFQLKQDAMVREALAQVCTPENVQAIINEAVAKELRTIIESEAKAFFQYGDGRKYVNELIVKKLRSEMRRKKTSR